MNERKPYYLWTVYGQEIIVQFPYTLAIDRYLESQESKEDVDSWLPISDRGFANMNQIVDIWIGDNNEN